MSIHHFILTRFNLRGPKQDKNHIETWNNPEWLQHRIQLFETYCFPSIKSQYQQNFKFLVGFDSETDPKIYQKYQQLYRNFVPILVSQQSNFDRQIIEYINQTLQPIPQNQKQILITTRIDSDDAFSRQATNTIQQLAQQNRPKEPKESTNKYLALDFHRGLYLNEKSQTLTPELISFTSAYGSLVEYLQSNQESNHQITKTVMSFNQGALTKENPTIHIRTGPPLWVRVIHTRNVLNDRIMKKDHQIGIIDQDFLFININYRRQIMTKQTKQTKQIRQNKQKTVSSLDTQLTKFIKINSKNKKHTSEVSHLKVKTKKLSKSNYSKKN